MIKLEKFKPTNLTVLELHDKSLLLMLNFESTDESTEFMQEIIEKHLFNLSISINDKKEYSLILGFPEREETFVFNTGRTAKNYPPFELLTKNRQAVFSCGTRQKDGKLEIYQPSKILDTIHLN